MPSCPSCRRPVAVARASCVYCGAPLPAAVAEQARDAARAALPPARAPSSEPEPPARTLVVIDLALVEPAVLARATNVSPYEAALLTRRRGLHLHRVLLPEQAEGEATRLAGEGIVALLVPEPEARVRPERAVSGELLGASLLLSTEEGGVEVARDDLLIVVTGPLTRQRQASARRPKFATATFEEGWCLHLHRLAEPRPIEIDAGSFEPGFAAAGSTQLQLRSWLEVIARDVPRDDAFRLLTPALAPAEGPAPGALSAVESLRARPLVAPAVPAPGDWRSPGRAADERVLLDNLAQFRFYSGWRAAVERRRRRAPASSAPGPD